MKKSETKQSLILNTVVDVSLGIILGVAVVLRFFQIEKPSFWLDEIFTFFATKMSFSEAFKLDPNMSLYNLLATLWVRIFPNATDGMLRALSAIISVLSIPVMFLFSSIIGVWKKKSVAVGLLASVFVAVNAYHIQYAQEFRGYSLLLLLSTLSSLLLLKAIERNEEQPHIPNPWWFWYVVASVASIHSHFFAVFILIAHAFSLFILRLNDKENFPLQEVLGSYIAIAIFSLPVASAAFTKGHGQISWITKPNGKTLERFAIRMTGNQGIQLLALSLFTAFLGFLAGIKTWFEKDPLIRFKFTLVLGGLMLPIAISLAVSFLIIPIFVDRYLIHTTPYLAVLSATGIVVLANFRGDKLTFRIFTSLIAIILFISILIFSAAGVKSYYNEFQKEDWRSVSQFLTSNCSAPESLRLYYMPYTERNPIYYNPELKSQIRNWGKIASKSISEAEVGKYINSSYDQVCLVISHVSKPYVQVQKNIESALEQRFPNVAIFNFYQVDVKVYSQ